VSEHIPFEPLEGFCLCEQPENVTTPGGLFLPGGNLDLTDSSPKRMKVLKVGPGEQLDAGRRREVVIDPGNYYYFMFPPYNISGDFRLNGKTYLVIQSKFVCGKAV
jgi:co-chaperonin GroES (HSP10)